MMTVQRAGRPPSADADRTALGISSGFEDVARLPTSGITAGGDRLDQRLSGASVVGFRSRLEDAGIRA